MTTPDLPRQEKLICFYCGNDGQAGGVGKRAGMHPQCTGQAACKARQDSPDWIPPADRQPTPAPASEERPGENDGPLDESALSVLRYVVGQGGDIASQYVARLLKTLDTATAQVARLEAEWDEARRLQSRAEQESEEKDHCASIVSDLERVLGAEFDRSMVMSECVTRILRERDEARRKLVSTTPTEGQVAESMSLEVDLRPGGTRDVEAALGEWVIPGGTQAEAVARLVEESSRLRQIIRRNFQAQGTLPLAEANYRRAKRDRRRARTERAAAWGELTEIATAGAEKAERGNGE